MTVVTPTILDGNVVLDRVKADLRSRIAALADRGVTVGLGTILVGDDAGSAMYIQMKRENCAELGIDSIHTHLPADAKQGDVDALVDSYNANPAVHAYLMQYPFPKGLDFEAALLRVDPDKDVDGLHPVNLGKLVQGVRGPRSCTPAGIQALLAHYEVPIAGRHVVIVGRGLTVGKALANLLSLKEPNANAAVTMVPHRRARPRPLHAAGRHPRRGSGFAGSDHRRHGEAGRGRGADRCDVPGREDRAGRRPGRPRGGRLVRPGDRLGRPDDPRDAAVERRRRRGARC